MYSVKHRLHVWARVFESCTGTLDDQPAPGSWVPIANIHFDIWREEEVWATEGRAGHIRC